MDWIKVRTQHYQYSTLTAFQIGALVQHQMLIATLERIPTQAELIKALGRYAAENIDKFAQINGSSRNEIETKVLQDVNKYLTAKKIGKEKKAKQREKLLNVPSAVPGTDKIREEKTIYNDEVLPDSPETNPIYPKVKTIINKWIELINPLATRTEMKIEFQDKARIVRDLSALPNIEHIFANIDKTIATIKDNEFLLHTAHYKVDVMSCFDKHYSKIVSGSWDKDKAYEGNRLASVDMMLEIARKAQGD